MKINDYIHQGIKLPIFTYPDPVLAKIAKEVTCFDAQLKELVQNMLFTMYKAPGIGLAAPQIGESIRLFVVDINYEREKTEKEDGSFEYTLSDLDPMVFINPIIEGITPEKILYEEGCLSVPGVYEEIERFQKVKVTYQDFDGKTHQLETDGLLAICLQHENDHLNGVVFIEKLSPLKKSFYRKKMLKQKKAHN